MRAWRKLKSRYCEALKPVVDDSRRTGLGLIELLFGFVLGLAFVQTFDFYNRFVAAGWGHLVLSVSTIVLSWVGYHNSRQAALWMMKFINGPFLQYVVDFLIVLSYLGLIVTVEGIRAAPTHANPPLEISAVPEATLILVIFALYFVWDCLEVQINEKCSYEKEWSRRCDANDIRLIHEGDRPRLKVTALFGLIFLVIHIAVLQWEPRHNAVVAWVDGVMVALLIAYRVIQTVYAARPKATQSPVPNNCRRYSVARSNE
jgi:hypothetical protein